MANNILLVVDVQNGFINHETVHIPNKIRDLILHRKFNEIAFTKFVNTKGSFYETEIGWYELYDTPDIDIVPDLSNLVEHVFIKHAYTSFTDELASFIRKTNTNVIYIVGIETDACVLKTALDALESGYRPIVLGDYCATLGGDTSHKNALELLKKLLGTRNVQ